MTNIQHLKQLEAKSKLKNNSTIIIENFSNSNIELKQNSNTTIIALISETTDKETTINFELKENAELKFIAIIIAQNKQKYHININSTHNTENTKANYHLRSILFDKSEIDYTGNIKITSKGNNTNSRLEHHSLMLSDYTKTNTKPCFEIQTNKVKASHAATIGRIDDSLLFYIKSRGLNEKEAKNLLIQSFIKSDLNKINNKELEKEIEHKLNNILENRYNLNNQSVSDN